MSDSLTSDQIRVGQIWQQVDPRFTRFVKILGFQGPIVVVIQTCDADGNLQSRRSSALRHRFDGKRNGYKLVSR